MNIYKYAYPLIFLAYFNTWANTLVIRVPG